MVLGPSLLKALGERREASLDAAVVDVTAYGDAHAADKRRIVLVRHQQAATVYPPQLRFDLCANVAGQRRGALDRRAVRFPLQPHQPLESREDLEASRSSGSDDLLHYLTDAIVVEHETGRGRAILGAGSPEHIALLLGAVRPEGIAHGSVIRGTWEHLPPALRERFDLPVVLHAPHGAAVGGLEALREAKVERAVFHWHKAPAEVTKDIVAAGYMVSVTPEVVYRDRDRELVEAVPLDSLLVESDGPWPYRGEFEGTPSGPWLVTRVAEEVAKIKHLPVDEAMYRLSVNACRLFDLVWS